MPASPHRALLLLLLLLPVASLGMSGARAAPSAPSAPRPATVAAKPVVVVAAPVMKKPELRRSSSGSSGGLVPLAAPQVAGHLSRGAVRGFGEAARKRRRHRHRVKPATADTCSKLTELVRKESRATSGSCKLVVPGVGGTESDGCECRMSGFELLEGCPFDCSKPPKEEGTGGSVEFRPHLDCVGQELKELGINKVSHMGAMNFPEMGGVKTASCMYWTWMENPFSDDVAQQQKNNEASRSRVLGYVKTATEWSGEIAKKAASALWDLTAAPWPVDQYGTPTCFGLCTTPNVTYWSAFTTTTTPSPQ